MDDESTPLANRVSCPGIENIWVDGDSQCAGIASEPLDPDQLPDDCEIVQNEEISGGKHRFTILSTAP